MYEVIVLGATFASAGIAQQQKENCLVIEQSARAGYEFFGIGCDIPIYDIFSRCHMVFCTQVVQIRKEDAGFRCLIHGVDGLHTYWAKRIVDTRCREEMCLSKTYDLLIESAKIPDFADVSWEKTGVENRYLLHCPVPLACEYPQARSVAGKIVEQFSETQRLILSADVFNYQVKEGYPKMEQGILHFPSKAYDTPLRAFEAGCSANVEVTK